MNPLIATALNLIISMNSHQHCPDFSGVWAGTCRMMVDSPQPPSKLYRDLHALAIVQKDCSEITIKGERHFIGKLHTKHSKNSESSLEYSTTQAYHFKNDQLIGVETRIDRNSEYIYPAVRQKTIELRTRENLVIIEELSMGIEPLYGKYICDYTLAESNSRDLQSDFPRPPMSSSSDNRLLGD